jgi:hypothetical protein
MRQLSRPTPVRRAAPADRRAPTTPADPTASVDRLLALLDLARREHASQRHPDDWAAYRSLARVILRD